MIYTTWNWPNLCLNLKTNKYQKILIFFSASTIYKYDIRLNQSDNKLLPSERTIFGQPKLEYKDVKIWNNLPNCIKYIQTLSKFSHNLEETTLESIYNF